MELKHFTRNSFSRNFTRYRFRIISGELPISSNPNGYATKRINSNGHATIIPFDFDTSKWSEKIFVKQMGFL